MSKKGISLIQLLKMFFGIFMVFFYLGVAVLLAKNFFGLPKYLSWFFAAVIGAYGLYRGYREIKGEHTYGMRRYDDEDDRQYTSYNERLKQMENNNDDDKN